MYHSDGSHTSSQRYNARLGIVLFIIYLLFYGLFVALSAFRQDIMARPFIAGVNLAIIYGFALIVGAFALAMVYMVMCRAEELPEETE